MSGQASPPESAQLDRYRLLEELGRGGMGTVYRALHLDLEKMVAVKVLNPRLLSQEQAVDRFRREMRAVGKLDHENIVRATDATTHGQQFYLVMELVDGCDLEHVVDGHGPLSIADACEVIRQAACGLQHAHENRLVHRDIKPSNLLLARDGRVKVLDLGLARLEEDRPAASELTSANAVMGTVDYMSPEQATDPRDADIRADVYSLGCTLYRLLTGRVVFDGPGHSSALKKILAHAREPIPPVQDARPDVPEGLAAVIAKMLEKERDARHATPAEVAAALEAFTPGHNLSGLIARVDTGAEVSATASTSAGFPPSFSDGRPGRETPEQSSRPPTLRRRLPVLALCFLAALMLWAVAWGPFGGGKVSGVSLNVDRFKYQESLMIRMGRVGVESFKARVLNVVQVSVELDAPGYCYLLAFNPDGREQLCFPADAEQPPPQLSRLDYPTTMTDGRRDAFRLSDGAGLQVFMVLASHEPLPSYSEWSASVPAREWKHIEAGGVWRFDGKTVQLAVGKGPRSRGDVVRGQTQRPESFAALCKALAARREFSAVRALAFPVLEDERK